MIQELMRFVFKVVLLGPPAVGKTSLVLRFVQERFKDEYITTLGADFLIKEVEFTEPKLKVKLLKYSPLTCVSISKTETSIFS